MLQIIVGICSVAAFALSVFNLCHSLFLHRRAIMIPSADLFDFQPDQQHIVVARMVISNLSECPIGICDLRLCVGDTAVAPIAVPARLFSFRSHSTGAHQEIYSTALPVRLGAFESRELFAAYPSRCNSLR